MSAGSVLCSGQSIQTTENIRISALVKVAIIELLSPPERLSTVIMSYKGDNFLFESHGNYFYLYA